MCVPTCPVPLPQPAKAKDDLRAAWTPLSFSSCNNRSPAESEETEHGKRVQAAIATERDEMQIETAVEALQAARHVGILTQEKSDREGEGVPTLAGFLEGEQRSARIGHPFREHRSGVYFSVNRGGAAAQKGCATRPFSE